MRIQALHRYLLLRISHTTVGNGFANRTVLTPVSGKLPPREIEERDLGSRFQTFEAKPTGAASHIQNL
jgi:hypothetical protein